MPDTATLLHLIANYGYPVLALLLFIASIGLPLPVGVALVALGALGAQQSLVSLPLLFLFGTLASVTGDLLPYSLGRAGGPRLLGWLRRLRHGMLASPLDRAQSQLQQHGSGIVFLSRFALTAIATPVSLLSGVSRLPLRRFLLWDAFGEAVFVFANLALGRLFGAAIVGNNTFANLLWLGLLLIGLLPLLISAGLRLRARLRTHAAPQARPRRLALPDPLPTPTHHAPAA